MKFPIPRSVFIDYETGYERPVYGTIIRFVPIVRVIWRPLSSSKQMNPGKIIDCTQGRRNEKKARGAENFKKAHCNYFELKPLFIDAQ